MANLQTIYVGGTKQKHSTMTHEEKLAIWNAAITYCNNLCVQVSDDYNNDDYIEQATGATKCAEIIRKSINDIHPDLLKPAPLPDDLKKWIEDEALSYANKIGGDVCEAMGNEQKIDPYAIVRHAVLKGASLLSPQIEEQRKIAIENLNQRDYWKARCEAAEVVINFDDSEEPGCVSKGDDPYKKWKELAEQKR